MRHAGVVSLAAFSALLAASPRFASGAEGGGEEASLPMEIVGAQIVVPVTIDGRGPFRFSLDTGAGRTVVDRSLARELKLPVIGASRVGDPARPEAIAAEEVRIESLGLGGATVSRLTADSWDRAELDPAARTRGALGMEVFAGRLLTLDYPGRRVVVARGELPAPDGRQVVAYRRSEGGTLLVPVSIGQLAIEADLDTGSPEGLALPKSFAGRLTLQGELARIGRGRTAAGEFVVYGARAADTLRVGSIEIERPFLTFNDYLPNANIGYRLLRHLAVTLDQKNRRVRFEKREAGPIAL